MTAFEDYINNTKVVDTKEREVEADVPYHCLECDQVWSYSSRNGIAYYEDFPKFQPKKKCRKCSGIKEKVMTKKEHEARKARHREYNGYHKRAKKVGYALMGRGRRSKIEKDKWLEGLEEAEAIYYG